MSETRLILHVKGTESQTTELPKNIVRAGIAQGQITRSQLIWSAAHNAWKQVRELPNLLPSQKLAPAPMPRVGTVPLPKGVGAAGAPTGPVPKIVAKASAGATPKVGKPMAAKPVVRGASADDLLIKQESFFPFMKWLCIVLSMLILTAVIVNYIAVDRPLVAGMRGTAYANVTVYAHLGGFMQPGALVIHVPVSPALTSDNLVDFLQALAKSTPPAPVTDDPFDDVSLTSGWTAHYSFTGSSWKEFGDMTDAGEGEKQDFLLNHLRDTSGEEMISPRGTLEPDAAQAERDKTWADFVAYFTK